MQIIIDLSGLITKLETTKRFSETLDFGRYSDGSLVALNNWDAFNDCLSYLDVGGIYGTSEKISFPLILSIKGYSDFKNNNPKDFLILKDILSEKQILYKKYNQDLQIVFEK